MGLTGADANVIRANKRPVQFVDYGYVGDVKEVEGATIKGFMDLGITPVFCAVTHDKKGQLLNTNADTIASSIATAMTDFYQVSLFYCFELKGVLRDINDKDSVIEHINLDIYENLRDEKVIADGMLPKLQNCFEALEKNVDKVHIGNAEFIKNDKIKHTTLSL